MAKIQLICFVCGKEFLKEIGEYNRRVSQGYTEFSCSRSCGLVIGNRKCRRPGNLKNLVAGNREDENTQFRWFMARVRYRTKDKEKESDLDVKYLLDLWEEQKGICPITGYEMNLPINTTGFTNNRDPKNASLDRIDSAKWYLKGNVRFVSLIANLSKAHWTDEQMLQFCKATVNNLNL